MKNLFSLFLLCAAFTAFAQKQNVYFLKNNEKLLASKDSADFIRVIQEPDSGQVNFKLLEYYPDMSRKRIGMVSSFEPKLVFEGSLNSFSKTGKRMEIETYEKGSLTGMAYRYHENGKLKEVVDYGDRPSGNDDFRVDRKLIEYYDSTGVQMVKDGVGHVKIKSAKSEEEGDYLNGFKNGKWKGKLGENSYEEEYANGKFVSGVATFEDGSTEKYNTINEIPEFRGGPRAFMAYVGRSFRYPDDAKKSGISGRVVLSFIVEKTGEVSNITILRSVSPSIDEEAIRIVKNSPKWMPGKQHGIPVRVSFTQPIMVALQ